MSKLYLDLGTNNLAGFKMITPIIGIDDSWSKIFIEPNPEHFSFLEKEIKKIPNSTFISKCVCLDNEIHELLTRDDIHGDTAATILGLDFINTSIGSVNQAVPSYNSYLVQGVTLKEIFESIKEDEVFIKIDIEGAEYQILENFPFEYLHKVVKIFVEFHAHDEQMRNRRDNIKQHYKSLGIELLNWD